MAKHIDDEVAYYYDSHPTEEDVMGETSRHATLVEYLKDVLKWLFYRQVCAIHENLNFYQTSYKYEKPVAPDLAIIKGIAFEDVPSWRIGTTGPAPHIVFEIASVETWRKDLLEKPIKYAQMGVQEYFLYDPNEPPIVQSKSRRLFGWQLDRDMQMMQEMSVGTDGRLWSPQLESFLMPDGKYLRLYDRYGHLCFTKEEAEARRADIEAEARRAEARRAAAAEHRAEAESRRANELIEKLRLLGIDPDQI